MSDNRTSSRSPAGGENSPPGGAVVRLPLLAWLPWIAAGGLAVLAGFLGQAYFAARTEMIALREQGALARIKDRSLEQQLEAERILAGRRIADLLADGRASSRLAGLQIFALIAPAGSPVSGPAVAVWDPERQEGRLAVANLPPTAPEKDYQFWIWDPQYPEPVNAGILPLPSAAGEARLLFKPDRPVTSAARFAISVERKGGAPRAEGPTILASP